DVEPGAAGGDAEHRELHGHAIEGRAAAFELALAVFADVGDAFAEDDAGPGAGVDVAAQLGELAAEIAEAVEAEDRGLPVEVVGDLEQLVALFGGHDAAPDEQLLASHVGEARLQRLGDFQIGGQRVYV